MIVFMHCYFTPPDDAIICGATDEWHAFNSDSEGAWMKIVGYEGALISRFKGFRVRRKSFELPLGSDGAKNIVATYRALDYHITSDTKIGDSAVAFDSSGEHIGRLSRRPTDTHPFIEYEVEL